MHQVVVLKLHQRPRQPLLLPQQERLPALLREQQQVLLLVLPLLVLLLLQQQQSLQQHFVSVFIEILNKNYFILIKNAFFRI